MRKFVIAATVAAAVAVPAVGASVADASVSQREAKADAQQYLSDGQAFSYSGLVSQVKFDGFSTRDAKYAVSHVRVNWYKEAAKDARQYLSDQAFSGSGLRGQLEFDGFTPSQAAYGVRAVGL